MCINNFGPLNYYYVITYNPHTIINYGIIIPGATGAPGAPGLSGVRLVQGSGGVARCDAGEVGLGCSSSCGKTKRPDIRTCKDLCGYDGYSKYSHLTLVCARVGGHTIY